MITESAAIQDIDSILVKLKTDLDKVRVVADKVDKQIQSVGNEFFVKIVPGLEPLAQVGLNIASGLDAMIDALDDVADGLASVSSVVPPTTVPSAA